MPLLAGRAPCTCSMRFLVLLSPRRAIQVQLGIQSKGSSSTKELCQFWAQKQLKHSMRGCDKGKPKCDKRHSFLSGGPD